MLKPRGESTAREHSGSQAPEETQLALIELFRWLKYFHAKRLNENLSQRDLLRQELKLIFWAIIAIGLILGFLIAVALWIGR
jgi:hypothetical protein